MEKINCIHTGKILKAIGYKGEMLVAIHPENTEYIIKKGFIFIEFQEELIPFYIEEISHTSGENYIINLEGITDTRKYNNCNLWFPLCDLPDNYIAKNPLHQISGFTVIDDSKGEIGKADEIIEIPGNTILRVLFNNKEILIPVHEDIMYKIDIKKKQIYINAPEGLIENYLG